MKHFLCLVTLLVGAGGALAQQQDTVRLMTYNLLNFANNIQGCDNSNNSVDDKDEWLATIVGHTRPDILGVTELAYDAQSINPGRILARSMNVDGRSNYQKVPSARSNSSSLINSIFYRQDKFRLVNSELIAVGLRDIRRFDFAYKAPSDSLGEDSVKFAVFVAHLQAKDSEADAREREIDKFLTYLNNNKVPDNLVLMGDFNFSSSREKGFEKLMDNTPTRKAFQDPVDQLGTWGSSSFADYHTQSTHSSGNGCHAGGGLDDRFDLILANNFALGDSAGMQYLPGTYRAVGQDGDRYNGSVLGANEAVPSEVSNALFKMSDHLPVAADFRLTFPVVTDLPEALTTELRLVNPSRSGRLQLRGQTQKPRRLRFRLLSLSGQPLQETAKAVEGPFALDKKPDVAPGLYLLQITDAETGRRQTLKWMKQ